MLIYEKENKLNINFENSVNETPDVQIGKDGDKTQILVDGQESGGGGGALIVTMTRDVPNGLEWSSETTYGEVYEAMLAGRPVFVKCEGGPFSSNGEESDVRPVYSVIFVDLDPIDSDPPDDVLYGDVGIILIDTVNRNGSLMLMRLAGPYSNHIYLSYYD